MWLIGLLLNASLRSIARPHVDDRGPTVGTTQGCFEVLNLLRAQDGFHLLQQLGARLGKVETNPLTYRLSASGFLAEIDRMQLEIRALSDLSAA